MRTGLLVISCKVKAEHAVSGCFILLGWNHCVICFVLKWYPFINSSVQTPIYHSKTWNKCMSIKHNPMSIKVPFIATQSPVYVVTVERPSTIFSQCIFPPIRATDVPIFRGVALRGEGKIGAGIFSLPWFFPCFAPWFIYLFGIKQSCLVKPKLNLYQGPESLQSASLLLQHDFNKF